MEAMIIGSVLSSIATAVGAIPALFFKNVGNRGKAVLLALIAGVMVAASTQGLIQSVLHIASLYVLCLGAVTGTLVLLVINELLTRVEPGLLQASFSMNAQSVLFLTAMSLHNLPEGMSIGISYASQQHELGSFVAMAIGLQNAPEGFLIALFLITHQTSRKHALAFAFFTGLLELAASVAGYHFALRVTRLVPYGLAFAAGAMLYIVNKELIPESQLNGNEGSAALSFIGGLLLMICFMTYFK